MNEEKMRELSVKYGADIYSYSDSVIKRASERCEDFVGFWLLVMYYRNIELSFYEMEESCQ